MSALTTERYFQILKDNDITPVCPSKIGKDYETCSEQWYHLFASETDLPLLASYPGIKWYAVCRCHLVTHNGTMEFVHALVRFTGGMSLGAFRKMLQRIKLSLHPKTSFLKIICLDHVVGVLRYICCGDGRKHKHYDRHVFNDDWLHERGAMCAEVRDQISTVLTEDVKGDLHDFETCRCLRGARSINKRQEANEKRKRFYQTEEGLRVIKKFQSRRQEKNKLLKMLMDMQMNNKSELHQDAIDKLIKLL